MLLHPLKSELNFPVGSKFDYDMDPERWQLPMHLLDLLFFHQEGHVNSPDFVSTPASDAIVEEMVAAVSDGITSLALQTTPHLTLLDPAFYSARIKPLAVRWVVLFLLQQNAIKKKTDDISDEWVAFLTKYIEVSSGEARELHAGLSPDEQLQFQKGAKLLHLARDWVHNLVPHVMGKVNRVKYGLLTTEDLEHCDKNMAEARRYMSVPFVGKDVPTRAAEFAMPEVLIGLTIMSYRFEGLRKTDVIKILSQLKEEVMNEVGPVEKRHASRTFASWIYKAEQKTKGEVQCNTILVQDKYLFSLGKLCYFI